MNLGNSIRAGAKWLLVGKIGNRLLSFGFGIVMARLLTPADFGMVATIVVFTGFVGMLTSGGMGQSLIRVKDADERDFAGVFTLQLALGGLVYFGFFVAAPWIADFLDNPLYADLIRVSTVVFLMRPFAYMRTSWLNRRMEFRERSLIDIVVGLVTGFSGILMAWSGLGVWSLTLTGLVGALTRNVLLARIASLRLRLSFDLSVIRRHAGFGFKITATDFLSYLTHEAKILIISKLAGPAFLGLFSKGESLSRIPNQLIVPSVIEPLFRAMSTVQDDLDKTKYLFYRTVSLFLVYTAPIYLGLCWISEPFIGVVYGEKWLPAAEPMAILVLGGVFRTVNIPCSALLAAQNRLNQQMALLAVSFLVVSVACVIGINWGLKGVAWGVVISQVFAAVLSYSLVFRILPTGLRDLVKAVLPAMLLTLPMAAALAVTHSALGAFLPDSRPVYLVLMTLIGVSTYAISFLFLPVPGIESEAARWRREIRQGVSSMRRRGR